MMPGETMEARLARYRREREIHCPYCDALWTDDEYQCVHTYTPDVSEVVTCGKCDREFYVKETVTRTYETESLEARA